MREDLTGELDRTMAYDWISDDIKTYKAFYKGKRFWVFENDFERPFRDFDDPEWHQILFYDLASDDVLAVGKYLKDGDIHGCVMWGQGVDFIVSDAIGMVRSVKSISRWYR